MKYLAQIVFIQILWHQFYKLYNNNLNANIFIQIIFLSMKLNVHWNHPLWLNTPFTFCDSPIEIIPSSRRVPSIHLKMLSLAGDLEIIENINAANVVNMGIIKKDFKVNKKLMIKCFDYCCNNKSEHSIIKHFLIFFYTFWVNIELIDNTMKKLYWKFEIRVILKILLSLSDCKNDSPKVFF